ESLRARVPRDPQCCPRAVDFAVVSSGTSRAGRTERTRQSACFKAQRRRGEETWRMDVHVGLVGLSPSRWVSERPTPVAREEAGSPVTVATTTGMPGRVTQVHQPRPTPAPRAAPTSVQEEVWLHRPLHRPLPLPLPLRASPLRAPLRAAARAAV